MKNFEFYVGILFGMISMLYIMHSLAVPYSTLVRDGSFMYKGNVYKVISYSSYDYFEDSLQELDRLKGIDKSE